MFCVRTAKPERLKCKRSFGKMESENEKRVLLTVLLHKEKTEENLKIVGLHN